MNHYHYCCYLLHSGCVVWTHTTCTFLGLFSSTVLLWRKALVTDTDDRKRGRLCVSVLTQCQRSATWSRAVELGSELKNMKWPHLSVKNVSQHVLLFVWTWQKRGGADVARTEELMAAAGTWTWTEGPLPHEGAGLWHNVAPFVCKGRR